MTAYQPARSYNTYGQAFGRGPKALLSAPLLEEGGQISSISLPPSSALLNLYIVCGLATTEDKMPACRQPVAKLPFLR